MEPNEHCSSCTYWVSKKGSFGYCRTIPEKIYDGTKKGTSCINWRQSQSLRVSDSKTVRKPEYKSLRGLYNKTLRPKFKATHATNIDGEFVTFTSDIHTKNGYYRHRYNYTIIDTCLTLFLNGKNYQYISNYLKNSNMRAPDRRTFREWIIKFLGENAWNEYQLYNKRIYPPKKKRKIYTAYNREYMRKYRANLKILKNRITLT